MNTFTHKSRIEGKVKKENVWKLYEDVSSWKLWDMSIKDVVLVTSFIEEGKGEMIFNDEKMPPLPFELTHVIKNERFFVKATLHGISIMIDHVIISQDESCIIEHSIKVKGENEQAVQGIGRGISSTFDACLENLMKLAQKG